MQEKPWQLWSILSLIIPVLFIFKGGPSLASFTNRWRKQRIENTSSAGPWLELALHMAAET